MDWNGLEWNRLEWNGLEWIGMEWNGLDWNGLDSGVMKQRACVRTGPRTLSVLSIRTSPARHTPRQPAFGIRNSEVGIRWRE